MAEVIDIIGQHKMNIMYEHPGTNISLVLMCSVGFWEQGPIIYEGALNPYFQFLNNDTEDILDNILLADKSRWTKIHKALQENDIPVCRAVNTSQGVKVYPTSISSHRELTRLLDKSEIPFTTFQVSEDRDLSAVLRGVNETSFDQEILDKLRVKIPSVKSVHRMRRGDNIFPLVVVRLDSKSPHSKSIFDLTRLGGLCITVEKQKKSNEKCLPRTKLKKLDIICKSFGTGTTTLNNLNNNQIGFLMLHTYFSMLPPTWKDLLLLSSKLNNTTIYLKITQKIFRSFSKKEFFQIEQTYPEVSKQATKLLLQNAHYTGRKQSEVVDVTRLEGISAMTGDPACERQRDPEYRYL
nr:unnamed protein product [Callosobruchus chinensis]